MSQPWTFYGCHTNTTNLVKGGTLICESLLFTPFANKGLVLLLHKFGKRRKTNIRLDSQSKKRWLFNIKIFIFLENGRNLVLKI
nr:hypothetical protein [Marseillevirus cajuinensis]